MMKKLSNGILFVTFTIIIYIFITNSKLIINSVTYSINILLNTLIPSLLPFLILSDILINYNYVYYLNIFFKLKYLNIIVLTMLSGLPSNAVYINELLNNNEICLKDAEKLLSLTFFPNPMFIVGTIGYSLLNDTKIGLKILLIIYLSNSIFYFINYKSLSSNNYLNIRKSINLFELLKVSILKNARTLLLIFGTITFFKVFVDILINYIPINNNIIYIMNLFIEITSGITNISKVNLDSKVLLVVISSSLSFSGLSVLTQAFTILENHKINHVNIIKNKIIISLINLVLSLLIL